MTLTEAQAQRLIQLYGDAEKELLLELNKALLKGNNTDHLQALLKNTRAIRVDLLAGGREWCQQVVPMLYQEGMASTGLGPLGGGMLHQQAMQVLAENAYGRLRQVDQVIGRKIDDVYRNMTLESVRGDVAGYRTWKQTAKVFREKLAEEGVTGFVDKAGRRWNMKTYSEMVARTTTRECMIEGTANRLLEHGNDLVEIIGGVGKNTCSKCKAWVGRTVSLTGKTKGYPTMADARGAGVFHGNCTHIIAIASSFEEEIAKAEGRAKGSIVDASPEEFIEQRDKLPKALHSYLTPYTAEQYRSSDAVLKLHKSGNGGYGLKGDELISVFSLPGKHLGGELVEDAIAKGAKKLDCLGDHLADFYSRKGFKVVKTNKWDDKYAPAGWDYEKFKRPNLYYMELK